MEQMKSQPMLQTNVRRNDIGSARKKHEMFCILSKKYV